MPTYKGFEYELRELKDVWYWKVVSGEQTKSGRSIHKAVATIQALKAIDVIQKNKRVAAIAAKAVKWAASPGLKLPK